MSTLIVFTCDNCWKVEAERVKRVDEEANKGRGLLASKQHSLLEESNYKRTANKIEILSQYNNHYQGTEVCTDQPNKIKGITSTCSVCGQTTTNYNWEFADIF